MELFNTISIKDLVMYTIKSLQDRIDFLHILIDTCDSPEVKTKLGGLLKAYYCQWEEVTQWFAARYYVGDEHVPRKNDEL